MTFGIVSGCGKHRDQSPPVAFLECGRAAPSQFCLRLNTKITSGVGYGEKVPMSQVPRIAARYHAVEILMLAAGVVLIVASAFVL